MTKSPRRVRSAAVAAVRCHTTVDTAGTEASDACSPLCAVASLSAVDVRLAREGPHGTRCHRCAAARLAREWIEDAVAHMTRGRVALLGSVSLPPRARLVDCAMTLPEDAGRSVGRTRGAAAWQCCAAAGLAGERLEGGAAVVRAVRCGIDTSSGVREGFTASLLTRVCRLRTKTSSSVICATPQRASWTWRNCLALTGLASEWAEEALAAR